MSRRKQLKPRHLDAEEGASDTGPNGARDQDDVILQPGVSKFRNRFLQFDGCFSGNHSDPGPNGKIMDNEDILQVMKENIPIHMLDEFSRCPLGGDVDAGRPPGGARNADDNMTSSSGQAPFTGSGYEDHGRETDGFQARNDNQAEMENDDDDDVLPVRSSTSGLAQPPETLQFPVSFGDFRCPGDPNIKLSTIRSTEVAVAQFAENNILPSDVAVLGLVLVNLQQQQVFQMHLLQQLQQQLLYATGASTAPTVVGNPANLDGKTPVKPPNVDFSPISMTSETTSNRDNQEQQHQTTVVVPPTPDNRVADFSSVASLSQSESTEKLQAMAATSSADRDLLPAEDAGVPPIVAMMGMSIRKLPFQLDNTPTRGNKVEADGDQRRANTAGVSGAGQSSRNRCRYCQKVFTSDSALQIHIRSHTGERPFKCSICGNRFSTKGNLKVHLRCHTDTYPPFIVDQKLNLAPPTLDKMADLLVPTSVGLPILTGPSDTELRNDFSKMAELSRPNVGPSDEAKSWSTSDYVQKDLGQSLPGWKGTTEDDVVAGLSGFSKTSAFQAAEQRTTSGFTADQSNPTSGKSDSGSPSGDRSAAVMPASSSSKSSPAALAGLPLSAAAPPPPPPLSMLSSMSTSFPSFPGPLFSSFSTTHRSILPANLANPGPIGVRPFGYGITPGTGLFRSSSAHSKKEDPLEQFMEVQKPETGKIDNLVQNIERKLSDPNQCGICYRTLSCKSALQMHYRTHTGERPFKCKICGRAFTTKGNLKTHMGVHRAKPPIRMLHQCPVCHKQFTNALVLQQHIRMHTGEVPKQLQFHPGGGMQVGGGMMIAPPAMNFMTPFRGYPFFPHGFTPGAAGQLAPFMIPSVEDAKRGAQFGSHFKLSEKVKDAENDEPEMDDQSKTEEDEEEEEEDASSSASSIISGNCEDERMEIGDDVGLQRAVELDRVEGPTPSPGRKSLVSLEEDEDRLGRDRSPNAGLLKRDPLDDEGLSQDDPASPSGGEKTPLSRRDGSECEKRSGGSGYHQFLLNGKSVLEEEDRKASAVGGYLEYDEYPQNKYSASLMALEEKVNEIAVHGSSVHPLQQMERIIQRTEDLVSNHTNHPKNIEEHPATETGDGRRGSGTTTRIKNSYSPQGSPDTGQQSRNFSFLLSSGSDTARRAFGSVDLSPKSFEAATGKPNTTCSVCFKTFACKSALDIHYRSHTKERPFHCRICDRAFSTKGNMKQHMMTHKGTSTENLQMLEGPYGSSSNTRTTLDDVEKSEASQNSMPKTPAGSSSASSSDNPTDNIRNSEDFRTGGAFAFSKPSKQQQQPQPAFEDQGHSSPALSRRTALRHLCSVCQKPFSSASALQIHMRTHTGDRPFTCTVCNKAFTTKGNLKVHMGTHMWNNGPSRRGRRMSVEGVGGIAPVATKTPEFFASHAARIPAIHEIYPFPGFHFPFVSPKLNELSVIQKMNGSMQRHFLSDPGATPEMLRSRVTSMMLPVAPPAGALALAHRHEPRMARRNDAGSNGSWKRSETTSPRHGDSGELDLSVKKPQTSASSTTTTTSTPPWIWKTSCHLCNKVCASPGALELHMQSHEDSPHRTESPGSVMV